MNAYCTLDDLKKSMSQETLIQLSNDFSSDTIDIDNVDHAIKQACEDIDGYLRARYELPLKTTPSTLQQIAINISRYYLYARRPEGPYLPEAVRDFYKEAIKRLEEIRDGKFTFGEAAGEDQGKSIPEPGEIKVARRQRLFGMDVLGEWQS